ncbi:putative disease resistance protein [Nymphaea thermarum]|nr:putative disease resistance protein [Nymphaea thermarum]
MGAVIDALVQTAISTVTNLLKETKDYILTAKDDLKQLQRILKIFQKAIKDADRESFYSKECDRELEFELKDVLYDAEDIVEGYRSKIEASKRDQVRKRSLTTALSSYYEDVSFRYQLGNKIKKINERLDKIKKDWDMVDRLKTTPKRGGKDPVHGEHDNLKEATHHIGVQLPIGRENDKKVLVEKLSSNDFCSKTEKGGASIISIVGKGGIGKTTLAKMIFNEVELQFGERRWWVCVSERPNRKDLEQQIVRAVCKSFGENTDCSLTDLCTQLRNELSKEKFLLVLDDVWEVKWWEEEIEGTLMAGAMGSKILITSRKKYVSEGMGAFYMHELQEFSFHESWDLFLKAALREGQTEEDLVMHKINYVGERIVKKCGGLPLVIKIVGCMMRTKNMSRKDWKSIMDSKIWEWKTPAASSSSTEIGGDILPGLMLSYNDLPYYLKSCFVYCCIYPKDYEIERETLIMQWVAHGLIEEGIDVEATANQYIEDLIRRCLIEQIDLKSIKLHHTLHDLALYIGGREYGHASTTKHTRHLSLLGIHDAEAHKHNTLETANKVRTLLADSNSYLQVYIEHLTNFKWLRVLSLRGCQMDELPKSIGYLLLVKYLDLSNSKVRRLPSSIYRLHNLQTLDLNYSKIEELPKEMHKLYNLRYLGLKWTLKLKFIAEGLGKLTNLRALDGFVVCDDNGDTKGCNISELKELNKLEGELSIEGLVKTRKAIDHVGNAQLLKEKHGIISLRLDFGITFGDDEQSDDEQSGASKHSGMLEELEPPFGLERLDIYFYKGKKLPHHMPPLKSLDVLNCDSLEQWPHHMPALEWMMVWACDSLKALVNMPALKSLQVSYCDGLEHLHDMPAVKSLMVRRCDRLKTLADMPALESLWVEFCGSLEQLPHDMPALEWLKVEYCDSLEQLPHESTWMHLIA